MGVFVQFLDDRTAQKKSKVRTLGTIALILFLSLPNQNFAQKAALVDSLTQRLNLDLPDEEWIDVSNQLANQYKNTDSVQCMSYALPAYRLADSLGYLPGKLDAQYIVGWLSMILGHLDTARVLFERGLEEARGSGAELAQGKMLNGLGTLTFHFEPDLGKAQARFTEALLVFEKLGDKVFAARAAGNLANVANRRGDLIEALEKSLKALRLFEEVGDSESQIFVRYNLGDIYYQQQQFAAAIALYNEILGMIEPGTYPNVVTSAHSALSNSYFSMGDYPNSLFHAEKGLEQAKNNPFSQSNLYVLHNVIKNLLKLDRAEEAFGYAQEALAVSKKLGSIREEALSYIYLGQVYEYREEYSLSRGYIQQGIDLANELGSIATLNIAYYAKAHMERSAGNYRVALEDQLVHQMLQDSIRNEDSRTKAALLTAQHEFTREKDSLQYANERTLLAKEGEIQLLESNRRAARLRLILIVGVALSLLIIGVLVARSRIRTKALETQKLKEVGEFKEAMTGMIAHDLKNPLSVILNRSGEDASTQQMANQMLTLVNNMLDVHKFETTEVVLDTQPVSLWDSLQATIEQVRPLMSARNIQFNVAVPENATTQSDPDLLLRIWVNFFTNAIKYSPEKGTIYVSVEEQEGSYAVRIRDEGMGIPTDQLDKIFESFGQVEARASGGVKSTGLGLTFCKLALAAHGSTIQVSSTVGEGTTFSFSLPQAQQKVDAKVAAAESTLTFTIAKADRDRILALIPQLRALEVYDAFQIEKVLEEIRAQAQQESHQWVESVINAAYDGNQTRYEELLKQVESSE
ncbi:MAG TPA: hypothetical protein DCE41_37620 [Cytophagales bacterium]|nr:hypothetical protein [Cytophagales bacterium]HAA18804.1 hypothetical protein [Cytophagales bacterium]HAP60190.1 hypothetical protein [Cytophagales bacterium]